MKIAIIAFALTAAVGAAGAAAAQQRSPTQPQHQGHQGMNHQSMQHGATGMHQMSREQMMMHGGPAGPEYHANMQRMHQRMMERSMDRDATRSWALSMIEHHQGAIDNSETVLKYAQDAEARRLATKTIEENRKGIAELRSWLQRHGGANPRH